MLGIVSPAAHAVELALEKRQAPRDHRPQRRSCHAPLLRTLLEPQRLLCKQGLLCNSTASIHFEPYLPLTCGPGVPKLDQEEAGTAEEAMPLHMDIVPIQRLVVIVAHGEVTADDLANNVKELIAARVAHYAKIIDVSIVALGADQGADRRDRRARFAAIPTATCAAPSLSSSGPTTKASPRPLPGSPRAIVRSGCSTACTRRGAGSRNSASRPLRPLDAGTRAGTALAATVRSQTLGASDAHHAALPEVFSSTPGRSPGRAAPCGTACATPGTARVRRWPRRRSRSPARSAARGCDGAAPRRARCRSCRRA